jgi:murein DD-endopeptidase MepM/ murein hydrolase activator NlpD
VKKGDVIGVEGNTGYSFGSHCHLEIRTSGNKVTSTVNTPAFTGIPNKTGTYNAIVVEEEDEPMTAAEKKEFEALQNTVKTLITKTKTLEDELAKATKVYHWWKEIPKWAYNPLWALYKAGYFAGKSSSDLNLSQEKMECLVVLARALKKDGKLNYDEE